MSEAYVRALNATNLAADHRASTTLGAAALATTTFAQRLSRWAAGDGAAGLALVPACAARLRERYPRLSPREAQTLARHVLSWYRDNTCPQCRGRGFELVPGTPRTLSSQACGVCGGAGRTPVADGRGMTAAQTRAAHWLAGALGDEAVAAAQHLHRALED